MAFTREELLAEAKRRGLKAEPAVFSKEEALVEARRRGLAKEPEAQLAGVPETAATLATGAAAEPVSGIAGLLASILPTGGALSPEAQAFAEPTEIAPAGPDVGAKVVEATREALTFKPRTEAGQQTLQVVGEKLGFVGEAIQNAEKFIGDETFEATGSPALAAAATTIPTVLLEAIGIGLTKGAIKTTAKTKRLLKSRELKKAVVEAAPEVEQIENVSKAVYRELDDSGVRVKPQAFDNLVNDISVKLKKEGLDPDLTPKAEAALNRLRSEMGQAKELTQIDTLRKIAKGAADSTDRADSRLGVIMRESIDDFLDSTPPDNFIKGKLTSSQIGPKYKIARELWGRARRSELINQAFEKAKNQASGFENGIVTQLRSILNNKKQIKFFKPDEISAMQDVVRGTTSSNLAKLIGRLGFSEGHATNILGGAIGAGTGALLFGTPGAVLVPIIGQVSRKFAQRLTRKGGEFADAIIRAGNNAENIASEYFKNTPKKLRNPEELSELFLRPEVNLDSALTSRQSIVKEAAEMARGRQLLIGAGVGAEAGAIKEQNNQRKRFIDNFKNIKIPESSKRMEANGNRLKTMLAGFKGVGP